ncbi:vetispiradiene synthase 2-like [Olea europaea subsp. europaea]|uniref:Vetispiradiene synthase 2-like n=1 Tax=Olea europaea subsp. europaea TaxID=158383 RepID=A0A8S0V6N9_OLEEU|nr:vetispiradiene synthase 2-like [Olea europaea subsp. europaea]
MNLIDTLERLGVSHHFEDEIEELLERYFNLKTNYEDEAYDLYTVALHFRLFRQHGYRISCGIFKIFKEENGNFKETIKRDARGLLSLYEAAYLRVHGKDMLEDAIAFTTENLKSMVPHLSSTLKKQVTHALVQCLHFGNPRIEAHNFISIYEEDESKNELLLRFAKLDYNSLQMLHKQELYEVSRWWKGLDLVSKLPYVRDRVVECFFWAMGVYHEPQYSTALIMLTKTIAMTSIIDDTYDAYGTVEELEVFTEAIMRYIFLSFNCIHDKYIKPFYSALLNLYEQFEEELSKDGRSYAVHYAKEALKELVITYHVEAKWLIEGYLPPFSEYMSNALITFEKERGQIATGIESYMKENGVTKEVAVEKFLEMATNAWKDIDEEPLQPTSSSREISMRILNLERIIDVIYKENKDGYTHPQKVLKPHIIALFIDPLEV